MEKIFTCEKCKSTFSKNSNLVTHMKTAKYCLKLQSSKSSPLQSFPCDLCCKTYTQKAALKSHKCVPKMVTYKIFRDAVDMYKSLEEENTCLRDENALISREYAILKATYETTSEFLKQQQHLVEKLATNPTYNITNISKQINNLEPLTDKVIKDSIENSLTMDIISKGGRGIGEWASSGLLKNKAVCTDVARKTFVWKPADGLPFKDFKGTGLAKKLFTYVHDMKGEELKSWISNTRAKIDKLAREDEHDYTGEAEILEMKLQRVCKVKSGCHGTYNGTSIGDSGQLCKEFIDQISTLLIKDSQEFIEEVVTELLIEEGAITKNEPRISQIEECEIEEIA